MYRANHRESPDLDVVLPLMVNCPLSFSSFNPIALLLYSVPRTLRRPTAANSSLSSVYSYVE